MENFTLGDALVMSLIGMAIVFAVLVFLMFMIKLMSKFLAAAKKKPAEAVSSEAAPAAPAKAAVMPGLAKGSCGEARLFDVPDATAAMLMAIVADRETTPLNELHFKSIKEVK